MFLISIPSAANAKKREEEQKYSIVGSSKEAPRPRSHPSLNRTIPSPPRPRWSLLVPQSGLREGRSTDPFSEWDKNGGSDAFSPPSFFFVHN